MIGGGGSTELSIVEDGKIIEQANSNYGAMDTTNMFPDIKENNATSDFDYMIDQTIRITNKPKNKADLLILSGGDYIKFYETLNYPLTENNFYEDINQPYAIDSKSMEEFDRKFFYETFT